jgi:hypothetical protein
MKLHNGLLPRRGVGAVDVEQPSRFRHCEAFGRDRSGSTLVEFALIVPPLFLLMFGAVEVSQVMAVSNILESATNMSSRLGKTGYTEEGVSREDLIREEIEYRGAGLIDMDKIEIQSLVYDQFDDIGQPEPWNDANEDGVVDDGEYTDINGNGQYDIDMGVEGVGDSDDVVVYTITYPWVITTPIVSAFFGDGIVELAAHSVVKNEPF